MSHLPADTLMSISIVPLLSIAWLSSFRSGDVADSRIGLLPVGAGNRSGLVLGLTGRLTTIARGDRSFLIRFWSGSSSFSPVLLLFVPWSFLPRFNASHCSGPLFECCNATGDWRCKFIAAGTVAYGDGLHDCCKSKGWTEKIPNALYNISYTYSAVIFTCHIIYKDYNLFYCVLCYYII